MISIKILYLANNYSGLEILLWLRQCNENIVGLVIHPEIKQKYGKEIIKASGLTEENIFFADSLHSPQILSRIKKLTPDIAISVFFGYLLKKNFLELFPEGCINLHPGYLPYNKGAFPNVWSIIEGTPSGVTIHYVDDGIDTGEIITQKKVDVEFTDTGESLYRKLEQASIELFKETWPDLKEGKSICLAKSNAEGSFHRVSDVDKIDEIDLSKSYQALDLINLLRARTFPPYNGAYVIENGEKIYLQLQLHKEDK